MVHVETHCCAPQYRQNILRFWVQGSGCAWLARPHRRKGWRASDIVSIRLSELGGGSTMSVRRLSRSRCCRAVGGAFDGAVVAARCARGHEEGRLRRRRPAVLTKELSPPRTIHRSTCRPARSAHAQLMSARGRRRRSARPLRKAEGPECGRRSRAPIAARWKPGASPSAKPSRTDALLLEAFAPAQDAGAAAMAAAGRDDEADDRRGAGGRDATRC